MGRVQTSFPVRSLSTLLALAFTCALLFAFQSVRADQPTTPAAPAAIPAARLAENVVIITIHGGIDEYTGKSVVRRINEASRAGAQAIVFELDTPGGEISAAMMICRAIKTAKVPRTVAWIHPNALSAGAVIALACNEIILAERVTMGDALPVMFDPIRGIQKMPEEERQKFSAWLLSGVVDSARTNGYDEKLVQGIVSLGVELWLVESTENPGEFLFIDRNEYRVIFGADPVAGSATLVAASPIPQDVKKTDAAQKVEVDRDVQQRVERLLAGKRKRPIPGAPAPSVLPQQSGTPFIPAAPHMDQKFASRVEQDLKTASVRRVITPADQGKWKLIEYVSDGRTLFTFTNREMVRYGLAASPPPQTKDGTINSDEELAAFFGAKRTVRLDESIWEVSARFLSGFIVRGLLIVIFLVCLFIEIVHPGLILPASMAALALTLFVAPPLLIGLANWWVLVAILLGLVLLAMEIFVLPGTGICGVLGVIFLFGGLIGTFVPRSGDGLFPGSGGGSSSILFGVATVMISTTVSLVFMYFIGKNVHAVPVLGKLILQNKPTAEEEDILSALGPELSALPIALGARGVALTTLRPSGRAQFGDQILDVVAETGLIESGQSVIVTSVSEFRIAVDQLSAANASLPARSTPNDSPRADRNEPAGGSPGVMA